MHADAKAWHDGYVAGQHSMDAEHRAIAMRLRGLRFDGGSHENLSRIAYAIYPCATGWMCESADGLRDKLIDLMGGVSDDTAEPMTTDEFIEYVEEDTRRLRGDATRVGDGDDTCGTGHCCAAADCDGGDSGEPKEVDDGRPSNIGACLCGGTCDNPAGESGVKHGGTDDDSGGDTGSSYRGVSIHLDGLTAYDVLDNERHKAVCALRRWKPEKAINNDHCGEIQIRLLYQLLDLGGAMMMDGADAAKKVRDRLIHLLGGDKPSGIDVLREMDEREADGRITDELRECVSTASKSYDNTPWYDMGESDEADHTTCHITEGELMRIADRIDEQFDRICQQQESVLQSTIDGMINERKRTFEAIDARAVKLAEQRNEARRVLIDRNAEYFKLLDEYGEMLDEYAKMEGERDNLLDLLRDARDEYVELQAKLDEHRGTVHLDALSDANLGETVAHLRIEKLVKQRDAAYSCADELSDELLRVRRERDEARDECDRLKRDMLDEWVPRTSYEEKVEKYRRAYMESDAWRKSLQEKLNAMRDAITAALNG